MREILTAYDVIQTAMDYAGGGGRSVVLRGMKAALNSALRRVTADVQSPYMMKQMRIHFEAPIDTGTITYDHTGGASERLVTFSDAHGISATNILDYSLFVDNKVCDIETYVGATQVTLDLTLNPGADLASGTSYKLVRRYYRLPDDFDTTKGFVGDITGDVGIQVPMETIMQQNAFFGESSYPDYYAIGGIQDQIGGLGLFIYPWSDSVRTWDTIYYRKPREIRYTGHEEASCTTGTLAGTGTTLTGTSTAWVSGQAGCIIRIGDATNAPTGFQGAYQFLDERLIHSVTGLQSMVIDRARSDTTSGAKFIITDPIDIDPVMYDMFVTRVLLDLAIKRNYPSVGDLTQLYRDQKDAARIGMRRGNQPGPTGVGYPSGGRRVCIVQTE